MVKQSEAQLQRAVAKLLDASGLVWQHSPNEGKRSPVAGRRLKDAGMKAGFPDVAIYNESDGPLNSCNEDLYGTWPCGVAIELKVGKNKPTPAQIEWHERLRGCGWAVEVCYTLDEVLTVLRVYYPSRFPSRKK